MLEIKTVFFSITLLIALFVIFNPDVMHAEEKKHKADKITAEDLQLLIKNPVGHNRTISAGNRCYIVGTQDGNFPPLGWHIADEMGGVWFPPLKALDGIWLRFNEKYLTSANKYIRKAGWTEFEFEIEGFNFNRKDIALDNKSGALFIYTITNSFSEKKQVSIEIIARIHPILSFPFVQSREEYDRNKEAFNFSTKVRVDSLTNEVIASAENLNRFVSIRSNISPDKIQIEKIKYLPVRESDSFCGQNEEDVVLKYSFTIEGGGEKKIIIGVAGSLLNSAEASSTVREIIDDAERLSQEKEKKYVDLANLSNISTPDEVINKAFLWNKLNLAMQIINSPGVGIGAVAGYPDYPWYFGNDGSFTIPAFLAIGQTEEAKNHLRLIANVSNKINNSSGKIIHELVTDGSVFWGRNTDFGNTNETCQFAKAVGQVWKWTGDEDFLKEIYPTVKTGMLEWLVNKQIVPGDLFSVGYGNAEVNGWGPKRLDVQCYAVEGFLALVDMADYMKDFETSHKAAEWAEKIRNGINKFWWMEDKGYYANSLTEDNKPVLLGEISAIPLESKIADVSKVKILFDEISKSEFNNDYGWGSMSIGSGIVAMAQANYGRMDEAIRYIKGIANYSSAEMPGDLPEHHPPFPSNTEHRQWQTNTIQLWGGYGLHFPLINNIMGIQPDIPAKEIKIIPNLPVIWNNIECSNMIIGRDTLDVSITRTNGKIIVKINFSGNHKLVVGAVLPVKSRINRFTLNSSNYKEDDLLVTNILSGIEVTVKTELKNLIYEVEYE